MTPLVRLQARHTMPARRVLRAGAAATKQHMGPFRIVRRFKHCERCETQAGPHGAKPAFEQRNREERSAVGLRRFCARHGDAAHPLVGLRNRAPIPIL